MDTQETEKIFGSYEKCTSVMKGHNNVKYTVGGNARYNLKSIFNEWRLFMTIPDQIRSDVHLKEFINQVFRLPHINNVDSLCTVLGGILELNSRDFLKSVEKNLNLYEPIILQLRKLFYVILDKCTDKGNNDKYRVEFCQHEPITRITKLLEMIPGDDICGFKYNFAQLLTINNKIHILMIQKESIYNSIKIRFKERISAEVFSYDYSRLFDKTKKIMLVYKALFPIMKKIEEKNISIAKQICKINKILDP